MISAVGTTQPRDTLDLSDEYAQPSNEVERKLTEIWAHLFEVDRVGLDDDFFELGGDSLPAATLVGELNPAFGIEFKQSQLLAINTPRKFAALIATAQSVGAKELPSNLTSINRDGSKSTSRHSPEVRERAVRCILVA